MDKLEMMIESTQMKIEWAQKEISGYEKDIRESAARYDALDMVTFLPGKVEHLKEATEKLKEAKEQLRMLLYLQKEEV